MTACRRIVKVMGPMLMMWLVFDGCAPCVRGQISVTLEAAYHEVCVGEPLTMSARIRNAGVEAAAVIVEEGRVQKFDPTTKAWEDVQIKDGFGFGEPMQWVVAAQSERDVHVREVVAWLANLSEGEWRLQWRVRELPRRVWAATPWVNIKIINHEVNRSVLTGKMGVDAIRAWEDVILGVPRPRVPDEVAVAFGGVPSEIASKRTVRAAAVRSLEQLGVSRRLAGRSKLYALEIEVSELGNRATTKWSSELLGMQGKSQQMISGMQADPGIGRMGGLHARALELRYLIAALGEEPGTQSLLTAIEAYPGRAQELEERVQERVAELKMRAANVKR